MPLCAYNFKNSFYSSFIDSSHSWSIRSIIHTFIHVFFLFDRAFVHSWVHPFVHSFFLFQNNCPTPIFPDLAFLCIAVYSDLGQSMGYHFALTL